MGQYQQWQHYQEVDQQLHLRLEQLETDLAQLQAQAALMEETASSSSNNVIIQALHAYYKAEAASGDAASVPASPIPEPMLPSEPAVEVPATAHYIPDDALSTPVSPALLAWSRLYLDSQKMSIPSLDTSEPTTAPSSAEADLLPADIATFLHEHTATISQSGPSTWLESAISTYTASDQFPDNSVERQTLRTNRLVERWLERWRKTSTSSQEQLEDQKDESHR